VIKSFCLEPLRGFRHKGLELLFASGKVSKVKIEHAERLRLILGRLNVARELRDMGLPRLLLLVLWLLAALAGCRAASGSRPGVDAGRLEPGDHRFEIAAGGRQRSYLVHLPPQAIRDFVSRFRR